jgi:uncharacterized protein YbjT (DUF2867 family)
MAAAPAPLQLLLLGATGAVGSQVLQLALADPRIRRVIAPTRTPLAPHPKLENPLPDFSRLPANAAWWQVDAVICALGSTLKQAGTQAAFAAVDRDLPLTIAALARACGATRFALNSSLGADINGNFYLRTKAEAEAGIRKLAYPYYTIVRPSLIDTARRQSRPAETAGLWLARLLRPLLPARYRAVKAAWIARALLEGVLRDTRGVQIIDSAQLQP